MPLDAGRVTHLLEQMHRTEDDAGDPIAAGFLPSADGARGIEWIDSATLGGNSTPFDHGNMGATETIDLDDGDWHRGTLDANCTITVTGFTVDVGSVLLFEVSQNGTGGWDITWDADVDFGGADDQPTQTASTTTTFMLWSSVGDTTIYGAKVGGGSGGTPATTVESETTFGIAPAVGTDTEYARQDHTHGSPDEDAVRDVGHWEVIVSGTAPPVAVSNPADDDWLYGWVSG